MSKFVTAATLAASVMAMSTVAAYAVPTTLITTSNGAFAGTAPTGNTLAAKGSVASTFDLFAFTVPFQGSYSVNAQVGTASKGVTFTAFDFFDTNGTTILETGMIGSVFGNSAAALDAYTFKPGQYYIGVQATGKGNSSVNSYAGTLSSVVSTVPLPNSVALFGAAVAGLGIASVVRRKAGQASA